MPRTYKIAGFLLVVVIGVVGCTKGPTNTSTGDKSSSAAKIKKMEDDYHAAVVARDEYRQKLAAAEQQQANLLKQLEQTRTAAAAERDTLQKEVKARLTEREALQTQYDAFRKNLKELLGTADAAMGALNLPAANPTSEQSAQK